MGAFVDTVNAISSAAQLVEALANLSKLKGDPSLTTEKKEDINAASTLARKKIANSKAKGGAVTKMYNGGMASGKKHMYLGGDSSVKDNAGLRALKIKSPETYTKITGRNA